MNKRVLFLVGVLSLSLLTWSFAALGETATDTADVALAINEYVSVSVEGDGSIDITVDNPDTTDSSSDAVPFTVKTNAPQSVSVSDDISGLPGNLSFATEILNSVGGSSTNPSPDSAGNPHGYALQGTLSNISLDDGIVNVTGEVTITVS